MANRNRHNVRDIFPGERWLYLKIYGGVNMCDILLVKTIYPLIKSMLRHGLITRWFFIRYGDPEFHLRVRVDLKDEERLAIVLQSFNKKLLPLCRQRRLYKVVVDTYERELERYGVGLMMQLRRCLTLTVIAYAIYCNQIRPVIDGSWLLFG